MNSRPTSLVLFCCLCAALFVSGCTAPPPEHPPTPVEKPARVDLPGDIGPFYETAGAFDDRVIFSFVPTGTDVSDYLATYEVRVDGTTRASAERQRFEEVGAADPIVISVPREKGACVWISITIMTPEGAVLYESTSSVG
ncbi:hypothetical protein E2N92_08305 [Methanofollis formosanus]|uniref:Lipoprotein n=1 Tax=Methanofollis formosanus TaxID=299308 RepID=A0A8G1A1G4_9EURY|nr:hypothetical protein [Methanofollis formosanus]QYZ79432.1 hypothetical protein E2N92_08305 [Methanofollis formosanus]